MSVGQFEVVSKAAPTPGQSVGRVAFFDENGAPIELGGGGEATPTAWGDITGKPAVIAAGADAAAARAAIGAGTSSVSLPATATAAELEAGTVTATRLVTPKLIHDEIARQIAAIPAA